MNEDKPDVKCDLADLRRVVTLMKQHDLAEVEWEPGKKIRVVRGGVVAAMPAAGAAAAAAPAPPPVSAAAPAAPKESRGIEIPSPMVGTFYRSPSPDASPYVEVGDRIGKDSPVCIVEAMKVMNEIKSEVAGEILEILVQNGEPVEFGQPLFLVRPAGGAG